MAGTSSPGARRVVVVTGGAAGIGAAIAEELGRNGAFVVTMDPIVSVDGQTKLETTEKTTADRIVAAGGQARASDTSVTDAEGVRSLFEGLVEEFGSLAAVVNVAGITRATDFAAGAEDDWAGVLSVHLEGYLNVLGAALPIMSRAGHGRILGVTSGSGWRPANTGAYGCAKRAVAALTWQIGQAVPDGVTVNALSPIAMTRMVTQGAAAPAPSAGGADARDANAGGLSLGSMPPPETLGPVGAYLASEDFSWSTGQVVFSGGSEAAWVAAPGLLEVARTAEVESVAHALDTLTPLALAPAESAQATNGGSNPRWGRIFEEPDDAPERGAGGGRVLIVTDDATLGAAVAKSLAARGTECVGVGAWTGGSGSDEIPSGFTATAEQVARIAAETGPIDAVVVGLVARASGGGSAGASGWQQILDEHAGVTDGIRTDAGWARAVSDYSAQAGRPVRLVTVSNATTSGGRSRAQAAAQLARAAHQATDDRVDAFAVSVETAADADGRPIAELVAHLARGVDTAALSGAELVAGPGWIGLRSHPHPVGTIAYGGPAIPDWFDGALRQLVSGSFG